VYHVVSGDVQRPHCHPSGIISWHWPRGDSVCPQGCTQYEQEQGRVRRSHDTSMLSPDLTSPNLAFFDDRAEPRDRMYPDTSSRKCHWRRSFRGGAYHCPGWKCATALQYSTSAIADRFQMLGSPILAPTRSFDGELLDWPDYYVAFDATRCFSRAAGRAMGRS
jgi:hypothetical protein